jgi:hypothetical protein
MARYHNAAAMSEDPVERMKHVMIAQIATLFPSHTWGKPLNPVLGETYETTLPDGTTISVEQVSHHPPVSYVLVEGPDALYRYSGYSTFGVKAYINSINLEVGGHKQITFKDGSQITFNNTNDTFGNTLIGTCHH